MPIYVIGHQNPDTDAICSAIAYADLLRQTTYPEAVAAACGAPNARTEFALDKAGLDPPRLIMDVRATAKSISRREVLFSTEHEPFFEVYRRMREHRLKTVPVVSESGQVAGMLPLLNILQLLVPSDEDPAGDRYVHTSIRRITDVLQAVEGYVVEEDEEEDLALMIGAMSLESFAERLHQWPPEQVILVTGDRPDIHRVGLEYGIRCLIVTGGYRLDDNLMELAREKEVCVLYSLHDTTRTALLVKSARPIFPIIERNVMSFTENTLMNDIARQIQSLDQDLDLYPVVDSEGQLTGVFSKSDLINPNRVKLVLVDHNEFGQAVRGADEAEVLEVVDHHRLGGGMITREPIRFVNEPVGSTCTIVARMFREKAIMPRPPIALCLVSGIVSDTLNCTSPTTTDVDRSMLKWLEPACGLNIPDFVSELFSRGSTLKQQDAEGVLNADRKDYDINGWKLGVAQVEELGLQLFWDREDELSEAILEARERKGTDFECLMITDITQHESLLLTTPMHLIETHIGYPEVAQNLYKMSGVVSRKKQLLPHLMQILGRLSHDGG